MRRLGSRRSTPDPERERRFLLAAPPAGNPVRRVLVEDRYFEGTRLRSRRMTDLAQGGEPAEPTCKLTQKVPRPDGSPGLITTIYLSAAEHLVFEAIPAATLRKIRASFPPFGVDSFEGPLRGLVLAEAEFDDAADEAAFEPGIPVVAEVTGDTRFTGARLARAGAPEIRSLLTEFGLPLPAGDCMTMQVLV